MPPGDLIREIGLLIATRRKNVLNRALQLQTARWIFSSGSTEQHDIIIQLVLDGLRYLIEELSYDRDNCKESEVDIPLLRWGCVHLALAISKSGSEYGTDPVVKLWAKEACEDPLPEVRHADLPAPFYSREQRPADI
jgi:hypothetical protein